MVREHKALAFANAALLALFVSSLQFKSDIRGFFSLENKTVSSPYFNALIDSDREADYIARKMRNLPGVEGVEVKKSESVAKEIGSFLRELGESSELMSGGYSSFKIFLDKSANGQSRRLIREYMSRLAGKKEVTFSGVKTPSLRKSAGSPLYAFFSKYAPYHIAAVAGIGWLFTLWLVAFPLKSQCFVIEKFQRKSGTSLKIYAWLWTVPTLSSAAVFAFYKFDLQIESLLASLALFGAGSLFFLKGAKKPGRFI